MKHPAVCTLGLLAFLAAGACNRRNNDENTADTGPAAVPTTVPVVAPAPNGLDPNAPPPAAPPQPAMDPNAPPPAAPADPNAPPVAPGTAAPAPTAPPPAMPSPDPAPTAAAPPPAMPSAPSAPSAPTAPSAPSAPSARRPTTANSNNPNDIRIPGIGNNDAVRVQRQPGQTQINVGGIRINVPTQNPSN